MTKIARRLLPWLTPALLLTANCSDDVADDVGDQGDASVHDLDSSLPRGDAGADSAAQRVGARIETRIANVASTASVAKFRSGAATATSLESLKYFVKSIQICESLETSGSAFNNPTGCLELYRGDQQAYPYQTTDDLSSLTDMARRSDVGFVDLMSAPSRASLGGSTPITQEHVRSYHYGMITWAPPIKLKARVPLSDGASLYTHDGTTQSRVVGDDGFRDYFTLSQTPLDRAPAEEAVVVLGNGGNWFKFQSPLVISAADIEQQRAFMLDLVFNPDGIIKGFERDVAGQAVGGNVRDMSDGGLDYRGIKVPLLDLAPIPHRASERVVRESYQGTLSLDGSSFDVRIELYSVEGDGSGTVYGVDVKSLVNGGTKSVPPDVAKVSFLERASDGSLSFLSFKRAPIITGLRRVTGTGGNTRATFACGTHWDRAAAEGGAALIVAACPSSTLDVTLTLTSRTLIGESIPVAVGTPDAGADASTAQAVVSLDGGLDGG